MDRGSRLREEARARCKEKDKLDSNVPKECDRYTNSPCEWSGTSITLDTCVKCGRDFPTWC